MSPPPKVPLPGSPGSWEGCCQGSLGEVRGFRGGIAKAPHTRPGELGLHSEGSTPT